MRELYGWGLSQLSLHFTWKTVIAAECSWALGVAWRISIGDMQWGPFLREGTHNTGGDSRLALLQVPRTLCWPWPLTYVKRMWFWIPLTDPDHLMIRSLTPCGYRISSCSTSSNSHGLKTHPRVLEWGTNIAGFVIREFQVPRGQRNETVCIGALRAVWLVGTPTYSTCPIGKAVFVFL